MMHNAAPRQFVPSAGLPGAGLPHDRASRLAARRAFVELKLTFMDAVISLPSQAGDRLRSLVRTAEEPLDLWLLRAPLFAALAGPDPELRLQRQRLRRSLDALFPNTEVEGTSAFTPF